MAKYGPTAQKKVRKAMHEYKRSTLRSGRSGRRVTSRKQAIAIGLSEARRRGAKVPSRLGRRYVRHKEGAALFEVKTEGMMGGNQQAEGIRALWESLIAAEEMLGPRSGSMR